MANKQRPIEDNHHVFRRCSIQNQVRDSDGNFIGVSRTFFELRPSMKETWLSCSWWEYFSGTRAEMIVGAFAHMKKKMPKSGWKNALLAKMSVVQIKQCSTRRGCTLRVMHTPNSNDQAYARITGLPLDNSDLELLEALSEEVMIDALSIEIIPVPEANPVGGQSCSV